MPVGHPTKLNPERAALIIKAIENGCTRKTAAQAAGIDIGTFCNWMNRGAEEEEGAYHQFFQGVTRADAICEARCAEVLRKAGDGYDASSRTITTRTVFKTRKTVNLDGSIVEESVPFTETTETVNTVHQVDWRAALEVLKRRRGVDWGDRIDIRQIPDDQLIRLLDATGPDSRGDAQGSSDTVEASAQNGHHPEPALA